MTVRTRFEFFDWNRVHALFGLPFRDPSVQNLFLRAGLFPDKLVREHRLGIYSMPPHDKAPCPVAEIDLSPSFRVRIRFKHPSLVKMPTALASPPGRTISHPLVDQGPDTFVLSGITYFLEGNDEVEPFSAPLPYGIQSGDDLRAVEARVSAPPTKAVFEPGDESGYAIWEDRVPVLHVLFSMGEKEVPWKVNVFLPPP
jgi:hypothetical protein